MPSPVSLILASKSPYRALLLRQAGLDCDAIDAAIDERAVEQSMGENAKPEDQAELLAVTKALAVSKNHPDALILGCDQILACDGAALHKAATMEEARRRLLQLSGKTHTLHSALALAKGGAVVWSAVIPAYMTMRKLEPAFVGRHLALVGDKILGSVGCYQIEGPGLQLFERIEGDYWTIIGLPLLPLLNQLRTLGEIDG
jgi:septum formation protein